MQKAFDILPPRSKAGTGILGVPPPKETKDLSTLEIQSAGAPERQYWHVPEAPVETKEPLQPVRPTVTTQGPSLAQKVLVAVKRGGMYVLVGLVSFTLFSLLFWGYNRYQEQQRAAVTPPADVAGENVQLTTQPSLRILNASGSPERLKLLQDSLEAKGYIIRSVGNAAQTSDTTLIYFRQRAEAAALTLAQDMTDFAPTLQKNDDLTGVDDIVILLGTPPAAPGG